MTDNKKFRLQNKKLMLTYKHHLTKGSYKIWAMCHKIKSEAEIFLAHETGDEEVPYAHTHVLIIAEKAIQTTDARYFDYEQDGEIIHPNIKKITTQSHLENCYRYMCKEDHDNDELLNRLGEKGDISRKIDKILESSTLEEAYRKADSLVEITSIEKIYNLKRGARCTLLDKEITLRPWQAKLDNELKTESDDRKVIWYVDEDGCTGKTFFMKYHALKNNSLWITNVGRVADLAQNVKTAFDVDNWNGKVCLINLARKFKDDEHNNIYQVLELLKDGAITCTKYGGGKYMWDSGHVIVFANWAPKTSELSADRWDIRWLSKKKDDFDVDVQMSYTPTVDDIENIDALPMEDQQQFFGN